VLGFPTLSNYWTNGNLPNYTMVQTGLFPGWDDLLIAPQTQQGIYWNSQGTAPNRAVTFEWYTSRYGNNALYSHFLVSFYENMPNVTTIDYLNMTDSGISSTVGIQNGKGE